MLAGPQMRLTCAPAFATLFNYRRRIQDGWRCSIRGYHPDRGARRGRGIPMALRLKGVTDSEIRRATDNLAGDSKERDVAFINDRTDLAAMGCDEFISQKDTPYDETQRW